ncbi:two-component system sensor histidine kinase DcuS [Bacillus methanolicus]|uniref:DcuS/MalK family sensor histidine kinase n=1 Tax=Bacillus methanolicus TaxID=1471 RepID=UPI00200D561D|nr:DcuS/MalK family sensor histidine kinase [Bacillus methanolicus]UQD53563.1 two-component system sensor histidine kinase DcuS [Bacillus methanolicus]
MKKHIFKLRLQTTITLLVSGVIIFCLLVTNYLTKQYIEETTLTRIEEKARNISRTVALSPIVIDGLSGKSDEATIQTYTEKIRKATDVLFIVVLDMNGIRKSHPNPNKIGKRFVGGDENAVFSGEEYKSTAKGTLGMSFRYFTSVFTDNGKQVGAVVVGILLDDVKNQVKQSDRIIFISMFLGIMIGLIGAVLLAKKVKTIMFGMEPDEIAKLLEQRSAMLEYAREGVLAVDKNGNITLVNQEATRLFKKMGIDEEYIGRKFEDFIPTFHLQAVIEKGQKVIDQEYSLNGLIIVANIVPILVKKEIVGAVATFRDKTDIKIMAEQLTGVRSYAEALRSQTHEFMNKLHVILGMVHLELYDQLVDFVKSVTNTFHSEVGFVTKRFKDPVIAGFLLGKMSNAREKGARLVFSENCFLPKPKDQNVVQEIVTILGNLIDNSLDAVKESQEKKVEVEIIPVFDKKISIAVADQGPGMSAEVKARVFEKGFSTKGQERGLGLHLVKQSVEKLHGQIIISSELGRGTKFIVTFPYEEKE